MEDQSITAQIAQNCYSHCVEMAVSIRDMDREYYLGPRWTLGSSASLTGHYVKISWKPPGALQFLEKVTTENLSGRKNLEFVTKAYFDVEPEDVAATKVLFECFKSSSAAGIGYEGGRWSSVETDLAKCLSAPHGFLLPLPLKLGLDEGMYPRYMQEALQKQSGAPEFVAFADIRTEFVKPQAMEKWGLKLEIGFDKPSESSKKMEKYDVELYKMRHDFEPNPSMGQFEGGGGGLFGSFANLYTPPFTIIHRRTPFYSNPFFYVNESKLTNMDLDRAFKIGVTKRKSGRAKGSALFTLSKLLSPWQRNPLKTGETMIFDLKTAHNIPWAKTKAKVSVLNSVFYKSFDDYLQMGLNFVRIYVVDFSESNWNRYLHQDSLHSADRRTGLTPHEEALYLLSSSWPAFSSPLGESFFYGITDNLDPQRPSEFVSFKSGQSPESHFQKLFSEYNDQLSRVMKGRSNNYSSMLPPRPRPLPQITFKSTFFPSSPKHTKSTSRFFEPPPKPQRAAFKGKMAPVLKDIYALIASQNPQRHGHNLQYFTVFVMTDGEIGDVDECAQIITRLGQMQVSVAFIGMGNGDFAAIRKLMEDENLLRGRNVLNLVHFRTYFMWRSALLFYKQRSDPATVFRKEVFTPIREQSVAYMRLHHANM